MSEHVSKLGPVQLAAGILFISSVGGWVFDRIDLLAPFVIIGLANGVLCVVALRIAKTTKPAIE